MATEDNVVRLKHLSSLASSIAAEIATLSGGSSGGSSSASAPNNADFALYVPNSTSIIVTGKQPPQLSIGSWSYAGDIYNSGNSAKVYSAPVIYNGDGTLSTDTGTISNGVLTVHDTDGIFEGVISAAPGNEYAASSLYFNHDLDPVTVPSDANINAAIQSVGAKFVPAVDNAEDFNTYSDQNIQFFDNRIKNLIDGGKDFTPVKSNVLHWGTATVQTSLNSNNQRLYIYSNKNSVLNSVVAYSDNLTIKSADFYKTSETSAVLVIARDQKNTVSNYWYPSSSLMFHIYISTGNTIGQYIGQTFYNVNDTIASAASSVVSAQGAQSVDFLKGFSNDSLIFIGKTTNKNSVVDSYTNIKIMGTRWLLQESTNYLAIRHSITLPSLAANPSTVTSNLTTECDFTKAYSPVIEFNGEAVTISKGSTPKKIPIVRYSTQQKNSSGVFSSKNSYAVFTTSARGSLQSCQLSSLSGEDTVSVNPWFEDNGAAILGLYSSKKSDATYVLTYKPGSYTKSNWLNNAFDVWYVDYFTPKFTKTTKKITDMLNELIV